MEKVALITGGNSGIGYATAARLRHQGCRVYITGRHHERLQQAAERLGATPLLVDMRDHDSLRQLAKPFTTCGLDYLVNNAAIARFMPLADITQQDFEDFFSTNISGPMTLIQTLSGALGQRGGSITNISSAIVNNGLPHGALYAATKGALEAMTRSLALELAPQKIRVNAVSPGATETPILDKLGMTPQQRQEARKRHEALIPLGRYARAEEVAEVVVAQLQSSYVTGTVWQADGGVGAY